MPLGTLIGGVAGGLGGSYLLSKAQDYGLRKLPDSWRDALGQSDAQRRADEEKHGTASFIGGLAPYVLTMRPGGISRVALPDNATALQRIMADPITARLFGGGVMGGLELGQEAAEGQPLDWQKGAIATGFGVVFNKPYGIGERLTAAGERAARRTLGRPEPAAAAAAKPEDEARTQAAAAPAAEAAAAAPAEPVGPPVTGKDFRTEIEGEPGFARDRLGRLPSEQPPTLASIADAKIMGPGVTEEVFLGSHEMNADAEAAARQAARVENSVIGQPPLEDVRAAARRLHRETFARYDELRIQEAEFRRTIEAARNPPEADLAQATAARDAVQRQLDAHVAEQNGYTGGPEARRLRAQLREAQRGVTPSRRSEKLLPRAAPPTRRTSPRPARI